MKRPIIINSYAGVGNSKVMVKTDNRIVQSIKQRMSWAQMKIFMVLLAQNLKSPLTAEQIAKGYSADQVFGKYKATLTELTHLADLADWHDKKGVLRAITTLAECVLLVPNYQNADGIGYAAIPPFQMVHWIEDKNIVLFELNENLRPLLLDLQERFTLTNLEEFQKLKNIRSGQLFMLMSYCRSFRLQSMRTFEVDWLKEFLNIKEESTWRDTWTAIRRASILVCKNTSINLHLVCHKRGWDKRKVTHITFNIRKHPGGVGKPQFLPREDSYSGYADDA